VRLSPLGTSATVGILYQTRMIDDDYGAVRGMRIGRGNRSTRRKPCPSATSSTTNPTWPDLGSNPGRRGGKPATNRLSYGTALPRLLSRPRLVFLITCHSTLFLRFTEVTFIGVSDTAACMTVKILAKLTNEETVDTCIFRNGCQVSWVKWNSTQCSVRLYKAAGDLTPVQG
jgi:hypothetical protein